MDLSRFFGQQQLTLRHWQRATPLFRRGLAGPEVRRYGTHFSASEGEHFVENDREESQGNSPTRFSCSHDQHYGK
jgi:hypothetical protein